MPARRSRRGGVAVEGRRQIGEHDDRRVRTHVEHRVGIGRVAVVLLDEVDRQRDDRHVRVVRQRLQAGTEHLASTGAGAPEIERVLRDEAVVEHGRDPLAGGVRDGRERDAEPLGRVGDQ